MDPQSMPPPANGLSPWAMTVARLKNAGVPELFEDYVCKSGMKIRVSQGYARTVYTRK